MSVTVAASTSPLVLFALLPPALVSQPESQTGTRKTPVLAPLGSTSSEADGFGDEAEAEASQLRDGDGDDERGLGCFAEGY